MDGVGKNVVLWCHSSNEIDKLSAASILINVGLDVRRFHSPEKLIGEYDRLGSNVVAVISSRMESGGRKEAGKMNGFDLFSSWREECYSRGLRAPIFVMNSDTVDAKTAFSRGADIVESNREKMQELVVRKLGGSGTKVFWCDPNAKKASEAFVNAGFETSTFTDIDDLYAAVLAADAKEVAAVISSMMESGGRKEAGKMNAFEAFAKIRHGLSNKPGRPIFAIISDKAKTAECYKYGADLAICSDNHVMFKRHGQSRVKALPKAVLEVINSELVTPPKKGFSMCLDCGSGGTRVWQVTPGKSGPKINQLSCPSKPKSPLAKCCATPEGRDKFAKFIQTLPLPCFIGATAGVRYAIEDSKEITWNDVEVLRKLLPHGCILSVLNGEEEGRYELRSLRDQIHNQGVDGHMLSMGGRSMQIGLAKGSGSACIAYSLPFSKYSGLPILQDASMASWSKRLDACLKMYSDKCAEEKNKQGLPVLEGTVFGVEGTLDVATALGIVDKPLHAQELLSLLEATLTKWKSKDGPSKHLELHTAVPLMYAVVKTFFSSAEFRFDFNVSWAQGYLAQHVMSPACHSACHVM